MILKRWLYTQFANFGHFTISVRGNSSKRGDAHLSNTLSLLLLWCTRHLRTYRLNNYYKPSDGELASESLEMQTVGDQLDYPQQWIRNAITFDYFLMWKPLSKELYVSSCWIKYFVDVIVTLHDQPYSLNMLKPHYHKYNLIVERK